VSESPTRLELRDISVVRAGVQVLEDVTVSLGRGEIVAIIGPNGAGKSTLLEAAIGAIPTAKGEVLIDGRGPRAFRERACLLGFLAGEAEPPSEVRVGVILDSGGGDPAWTSDLEARLGLAPLRRAHAGTLSRGERRRLLLFEALAAERPFLLLDEPTGVFDPLQLIDVVTLLRAAAGRGAGLLITVHQMSDAEALGARLVILNGGRVIADGALDVLRTRAGLPATAPLQEIFLALLRKESPHAPA
jgi:ABC-type multidrug transport system ATPase subunit